MKANEVHIGETYLVKIGGNKVEVTITKELEQGGWEVATVKTGKTIRIKSPERFVKQNAQDDDVAAKVEETTTPTTSAKERDTGETSATSGEEGGKPMTLLTAAAHVLANSNGEQMSCATIVNLVVSQGLWKKGKGKTPANTLHAAIAREIRVKGEAARFQKTERGKFAFNAAN